MLLPKNLVEKLNENGITVTHAVRTKRPLFNCVDDSYLFTKKSPTKGVEWKAEIGGGCPTWENFVSAVANYYLNFSSEEEAIKLYKAQEGNDGERWSLQHLLYDMNSCYDSFVVPLSDLFSKYEYTKQDEYENLAYTAKVLFEDAIDSTTARSQDKEKPLVSAILHRRPFFRDCEGVSSLFTTYLVTEKIVDFLSGEKLTDEQKAFILAQENSVEELVKETKHGFDYFMSEAFFNDVIPEALNMLMNSQSGECEGENNNEKKQ